MKPGLIIVLAIFIIVMLKHQTVAIGSLNGRILGSKGRVEIALLMIRPIIYQLKSIISPMTDKGYMCLYKM